LKQTAEVDDDCDDTDADGGVMTIPGDVDPDLEAPIMAEAVIVEEPEQEANKIIITTLEEDAQEEERLACILSKYQANNDAAHVINDATPNPKPNNDSLLFGPSGRTPFHNDFRRTVAVASLKTTEVNAGGRKNVITTDPLNGRYAIQFERNGSTLINNGNMELTFTHGFCGWNIHGTRRNHTSLPFKRMMAMMTI
jgi:hypothetical protein